MEDLPVSGQNPPAELPSAVPPRVPLLRRMSPMVFVLLSLALVFFLYQIVGGGITLLLSGAKVTEENVTLLRWTTLLGQVIFIMVPTILLARARHAGLKGFFRLRLPDYRQVILALVAVFALQQMAQGYMILQDSIPLPPEIQKFIDLFKRMFEETYRLLVAARTPQEFLFVVVTVALVPALSEELLFRGLVQRNLEFAYGGLRGALIAGVIFGAYHLNPFSLVPLAALGMYFGYLVYRSGNITLAMAAHFFNNFIACAALYLNVDDDFLALAPSGKGSVPVLVTNFLLFTVVFLAATYYFRIVTERVEPEDTPPPGNLL